MTLPWQFWRVFPPNTHHKCHGSGYAAFGVTRKTTQ
ncbi:hypothetical protein RS85_01158 [Microbacterium sp. SA39]|nr:hypothetical protein RS85_01158 [Microbacterium sp. SA39]